MFKLFIKVIIFLFLEVGEYVKTDEVIATLETEKTSVEFRAESSGVITKLFAQESEEILISADFVEIDTSAKNESSNSLKEEKPKQETKKEEIKKEIKKEEVQIKEPSIKKEEIKVQVSENKSTSNSSSNQFTFDRKEKIVPLNKMRKTIASRLKQSQNEYATLTTFNEVDMGDVMALRNKYQDDFVKKYGIKLGLMSFFLKASTIALQEMPIFNSVIDKNMNVVSRNYIDISVAVASPTGLLVPVIRNCSNMNYADFEKELSSLGNKARDGKISLEDMEGGNFTISNGGVYGSLFGTPIINPPQTAILGMHNIVNRPVVYKNEIVARPIMYLALSYDHRLVDGKEAVTFLKRIKDLVECPEKLLLEI